MYFFITIFRSSCHYSGLYIFFRQRDIFAKEILRDLLIASDTELRVVLFTGTKIIKMTASKAKSVPKPNKKLQTTDSCTKEQTNKNYLTHNIFDKDLNYIY